MLSVRSSSPIRVTQQTAWAMSGSVSPTHNRSPHRGGTSVNDVELTINCGGMINGEVVTASGSGQGSVDRGTLAIDLEFSHIPPGFSIYCASHGTACSSTPTVAIARAGG